MARPNRFNNTLVELIDRQAAQRIARAGFRTPPRQPAPRRPERQEWNYNDGVTWRPVYRADGSPDVSETDAVRAAYLKKKALFDKKLVKQNLNIPISLLNTTHKIRRGTRTGRVDHVHRFKGIRLEYDLIRSVVLGKPFRSRTTKYDPTSSTVTLSKLDIARLDGMGKVREINLPHYFQRPNLFRHRLRQLGVNCYAYKGGSVVMSSEGKRLKLKPGEWTTLPIEFQSPVAKEELVEYIVSKERKPQNILPLVPVNTPFEYKAIHSYCTDFFLRASAKLDWNSAIGKFVVRYEASIYPKPQVLIRGLWNPEDKGVICCEYRVVTYTLIELMSIHRLLYVTASKDTFTDKMHGLLSVMRTKFHMELAKKGFHVGLGARSSFSTSYDAPYTPKQDPVDPRYYSINTTADNANGWSNTSAQYINIPPGTYQNGTTFGTTEGTFAYQAFWNTTNATTETQPFTVTWTAANHTG